MKIDEKKLRDIDWQLTEQCTYTAQDFCDEVKQVLGDETVILAEIEKWRQSGYNPSVHVRRIRSLLDERLHQDVQPSLTGLHDPDRLKVALGALKDGKVLDQVYVLRDTARLIKWCDTYQATTDHLMQ